MLKSMEKGTFWYENVVITSTSILSVGVDLFYQEFRRG